MFDPEVVRKEYMMLAPELRQFADQIVTNEKHLENTLKFVPHKFALDSYVKRYKGT